MTDTHTPVAPRRSKRSRNVALTTMAVMSSSVLLSACGSDADAATGPTGNIVSAKDKGAEKVALVDNIFTCKSQLGLSEEQCRAQQTAALGVARTSAPRFAALADCEKKWGQGKCVEENEGETQSATQTDHSGHHHRPYFSPFVTGYILGKMSRTPVPVYGAPGGGYQTANGWRLSYAGQPGRYYSSARAIERPRTVPKIVPASKLALKSGFGLPNRKTAGFTLASRAGGAGAKVGGKGG